MQQRGFTLLEVLIVLGLVAALLGVVTMFAINPAQGALRSETMTVVSALRSGYHGAITSGNHHRVTFDLGDGKKGGDQKFQIEVCQGAQVLRKSEQEDEIDPDKIEELSQPGGAFGQNEYRREIVQADSAEASLAAAAAVEGIHVGEALCRPLTHSRTGVALAGVIGAKGGTRIAQIAVQHLERRAEEGKVSINFFPEGRGEKAVIALENDGDERMWVLVHGLTGRMEVSHKDDFDIDSHMRRNALGDDVEDER